MDSLVSRALLKNNPAFRKWFGKSKLVDEEGLPRIMYHGTTAPDFDRFKRRLNDVGVHVGTLGQAEDRLDYLSSVRDLDPLGRNPMLRGGPRLIPLFVRAENPLRLEDAGMFNMDNLPFYLDRSGLGIPPWNRNPPGWRGPAKDWGGWARRQSPSASGQMSAVRDALRGHYGHDSIVYRNTGEMTGARAHREAEESLRDDMLSEFGTDDLNHPDVRDTELAMRLAELNAKHRALREAHGVDSYAVFDPRQLKSVFNRGTWDPRDPRIGFAGGGRGQRAIEYLKKVLPQKYAGMDMQPLRGGSGRVPVKLGENLIAKVANMPRGLRENAWSRDYLLQGEGVIPRLEEMGPDDDWIITEFLRQNRGDAARARDLTGRLSGAYMKGGDRSMGWESDALRGQLESERLGIFSNYGEGMFGDFSAPRHWRFRGEQPVLIDIGAILPDANAPMPVDELRPILDRRVELGAMSPRMRSGFYDRELPREFGFPAGRGVRADRRLGFQAGGYASVAKALTEGKWRPPQDTLRAAMEWQKGRVGEYAKKEHDSPLQAFGKSGLRDFEEAMREAARRSSLRMRLDAEAVDGVYHDPGHGILNQHEMTVRGMPRSGGFYDPSARRSNEVRLFGYDKLAEPEELPKHGYLWDPLIDPRFAHVAQGTYGSVALLMKDAVRPRTTITLDDSLWTRAVPSTIDRPRFWSLPSVPPSALRPHPQEVISGLRSRGLSPFRFSPLYVEAQMHGPLSVRDVEGAILPQSEMEKAGAMLRELGVPVERAKSQDYAGGGAVRSSLLSKLRQMYRGRSPNEVLDNEGGLGWVPFGKDIDYFGFRKPLKPWQYRDLAAPLRESDVRGRSIDYILEQLEAGEKLGNPMLFTNWNDQRKLWEVAGHEGRHRARVLGEVFGEQPFDTLIKPTRIRARDLDDAMRDAPYIPEGFSEDRMPGIYNIVRPRRYARGGAIEDCACA